ncbi:histidine kinase, partial [Methylobacterium sp. WL9]
PEAAPSFMPAAPPAPPLSPQLSLPPAPPLEPETPADEPLPEPGPPPAFTAFVPPQRRQKTEDASAAPTNPALDADSAGTSVPDIAPPENGGGRRRPKLDVKAPRTGRSRQLRNLFVGAVLAVVIGLIAVAAIMLADKRSDLPQSAGDGEGSSSSVPDAKLSDRVGGERPDSETRQASPDTGSRTDLAVAQRAVLYEENPNDPKAQPAATQGRVVWRLEAVNGEQGQPLQSVVRANIDYPEAGLTLSMTIRRNLDATLPASHTIELAFTNYGPGEKRAVQEIGLLQLKDEESSRGSSVYGLPVRVRDNLFLIGLSNLPGDIERNTEMLTHRNWMDLAVKYKAGPRAILTFEKGSAGSRVIQDAFNQWK